MGELIAYRRSHRAPRRRLRLLGAALPAVLMAHCEPQCAPLPPPPAAFEAVAPLADSTISWPGRSPVAVVGISTAQSLAAAQRALDAGRAVDITGDTDPWDGYAHVAGHYSSNGAVFRTGPSLQPGTLIRYNGRHFVVVSRESARTGEYYAFRRGLTVQYSGCGSVCLVHADPLG